MTGHELAPRVQESTARGSDVQFTHRALGDRAMLWIKPVLAAVASLGILGACAGVPSRDPGAATAPVLPDPPYYGQSPPGTTPESFAPGVVNTGAVELNGVFTPDGREFFFARLLDGIGTIFHSTHGPDGWSAPVVLEVYGDGVRSLAVDMAISPDGQSLYFLGEHAHAAAPGEPGADIWVSHRVDGRWSLAEVVPAPVSTGAQEYYPTVVADGSLYFSSDRAGNPAHFDLYRAQRLADGDFAEPVKLPPPINHEAGIGDVYVTPDERILVFSSRRQPSHGNGDLFVSFRQADGGWSEPRNLGPTINTAEHEFCPMATPDGKYLFYSRRWGATWELTTDGEVYWVDARILEPLR
jgi:hypothetical protein